MEQLFIQASNRLQAQVSELRMIDFNYGQLDVLDQDMVPAVVMPCALIDISYTRAEDVGNDEQQVEARVTIRLAFRMPYPTDNLTASQRRNKALDLMKVVRKTYKALQGWGSDDFSTLSRVRQASNNRYPGVKIVEMEFSTVFIDL